MAEISPSRTAKPSAASLEALRALGLIPAITPELIAAEEKHPVLLTAALTSLIDPNDPQDAVAKQFIPDAREIEPDDAAMADPIGDESHSPVTGIVHRYPDRLLLNLVQACPAYCRFCFRRGRVGPNGGLLSEAETIRAVDYIRAHKEVWEVILSGGEPLSLSHRRLDDMLTALRRIPHVRNIRIHTRAPITQPESFTPERIALLAGPEQPVVMMVHCNHPAELGPDQRDVLGKLTRAGIALYSQSVLLKGVNDSTETLAALMRSFVECGIKPHYLHHPDKAEGTRHFRLPLSRGIALVQSLRGVLSGLCQPTYMVEIPGGFGKVQALSDAVVQTENGYKLRSFKGDWFDYADN